MSLGQAGIWLQPQDFQGSWLGSELRCLLVGAAAVGLSAPEQSWCWGFWVCCSANTSFLVWWTRSRDGSDLKTSIWLLQCWQELFWLMELHPFSPKRLECAKTVSLKQRNCLSLAWKWVLAMCELCQVREGGKPLQAASFLLPLSLTCLPSAVPRIFHGLAYETSDLTRLSPNHLALLSCGNSWVA